MFKGITAVKRNKIRKIRVCLELTCFGKEYSSQWGSLWIASYINTTVSIKHGVSKRVKIRYIFINNNWCDSTHQHGVSKRVKIRYNFWKQHTSKNGVTLHIKNNIKQTFTYNKTWTKHGKLTDDNRKKAKTN